MALVDFLYRCPFCGQDPMTGAGDVAHCPACSRRFEPAPGGTRIRVVEDGVRFRELLASELSTMLDRLGGPTPRATRPDGVLEYSSRVEARFAHQEEAVRYGGELLGFAERFGPAVRGELRLRGDALHFSREVGDELSWHLLRIRALQTASSAVQISSGGGGVISFRFAHDSPRRWDELLRAAIRVAWSEAGLGEIVEFQPRIRAV